MWCWVALLCSLLGSKIFLVLSVLYCLNWLNLINSLFESSWISWGFASTNHTAYMWLKLAFKFYTLYKNSWTLYWGSVASVTSGLSFVFYLLSDLPFSLNIFTNLIFIYIIHLISFYLLFFHVYCTVFVYFKYSTGNTFWCLSTFSY